jgi:hypothetical protein
MGLEALTCVSVGQSVTAWQPAGQQVRGGWGIPDLVPAASVHTGLCTQQMAEAVGAEVGPSLLSFLFADVGVGCQLCCLNASPPG